MTKHFCDICEKEMKYSDSFIIYLRDVNGNNRGDFEVCQRCFSEITAALHAIPKRDTPCL